jgi:hypothetical protein
MSKSYESREAQEYAYRYHYAPLHRYDDSDDDYDSGDQESVRRQKPQRPTEMTARLQMLRKRGEKDPTSWFYKGPKKVHFRSQNDDKKVYEPMVISDAQKRQRRRRVAQNYGNLYSISAIGVHILVDKQGSEYIVPERYRVSINKLPPNFMYFGGSHNVLQEIVPVSLPGRETENKPVIYNIGHRRKQQTANVSTIVRFTQNGNNLETDANVITPLTNNDVLNIVQLGRKGRYLHDEKTGISYKIAPVP